MILAATVADRRHFTETVHVRGHKSGSTDRIAMRHRALYGCSLAAGGGSVRLVCTASFCSLPIGLTVPCCAYVLREGPAGLLAVTLVQNMQKGSVHVLVCGSLDLPPLQYIQTFGILQGRGTISSQQLVC